MHTTLDHIVIAVSDLDAATQDYHLLLGRGPSGRASRPELNAHSVRFQLDNTCIDLVMAAEASMPIRLTEQLETRDAGLVGLAFGIEDLDAFAHHLRARGISPLGSTDPDIQSASWPAQRCLSWPTDAARGVLTFGVEPAPSTAPPPSRADCDSPLTGLDHVVITTTAPDAATCFYGDTLGIRLALRLGAPRWGGELLFFRTSHLSIEILATERADPERDRFWGLAFKTPDVDASRARLHAAGITVSEVRPGRKPGTRVCTVKSHQLGVRTLLVGPDQDDRPLTGQP